MQVKSSSPLSTCFPRKIADTDPVKVQNLLLSRRKEMDKGRDEDWGPPRLLVLVAPFLEDGSLNGHRIYSDRRIYSPPDWNLGGRGRFSVTKDGFETCKILKKMSAGLICFIARETASRYWGNQGHLYPTKVKYTPTFCFWHLMWSIESESVLGIWLLCVYVFGICVSSNLALCVSLFGICMSLY